MGILHLLGLVITFSYFSFELKTEMFQNLTDKELLAASDEEASFRLLYDRYWEALYNKALNKLGNDADAQDTVQEIFISLWRNRQSIQIEDSIAPYLFTALKYCIIKRLYREAKKKTSHLTTTIEAFAKTELTTDELIQYKELSSIIASETALLPERMREIYRLSRVEYLTILEIAQQLNLSEQTVKNTLSTALKRLRESIARHSNWMLFLL